MEELIVRIQYVLRHKIEGPKKATGDTGYHRQIQFSTESPVIDKYGREDRKLSYRENELLKLLYENHNKIIDRKDILKFIMGQ